MAGIAFLRRLLMKQAMKKSAGSSGIMSLNKNLANDVEIQVKKWVDSAKKQGQDIDKMGEQEIKYIVELNKPKPIKPISVDSPEGKIITQGLNDMLGKASGENVIKTDFGGGVTDIVTETITKIKVMKPIDGMKEANSVIGRKGKYKNLTKEQSQRILKETDDHIFQRDIKYDEFGEEIIDWDEVDKIDPEDFAHGGRTGYGIGTLVKEKIPPEYRLYAKSILPGGESGKVGSDYFSESFKRELRGQALDKYKRTGKLTGQVGEREQHRGDPTLNKLLNFPSTYAALGTYTYEIDPKTMDVRITDKYDWNPDYGTRKIGGEEMTGWHKPTRSFKGKDVDLGMFKQLAKESWKNKSIDKANLLEMVGNYFGGKESEGKGFDVNIDIPTKEATSATEGSFAQGGRTGSGLNYLLGEDDQNSRVPYGLGGGFNAARRAFLKLMGAGAAGTVAAKSGLLSIFKGGATKSVVAPAVHHLNQVKAGVDGMPLWFKPLVNKVIKEGDDVSKRFATQERQVVHQSTLPDSKTDVIVTQDLTTGNVSVDIGIGKHGFSDGHLGQPVRLEYRASEVIEPTINKQGKVTSKGTKTKPEFNVEEAEFSGGHPENIKFEESTIEKFGEHGSDFSEVEKFATGKTTKASKKGSKQVWEADWDDSLPDYEDFASGGRVPLRRG